MAVSQWKSYFKVCNMNAVSAKICSVLNVQDSLNNFDRSVEGLLSLNILPKIKKWNEGKDAPFVAQ